MATGNITPLLNSSLILLIFSLFILHTSGASSYYSYYARYEFHERLNFVEREALITFNETVANFSCLIWNRSLSACSWRGVTCNPSGFTVLYLNLPAKNLSGEIPPDTIGKLTSLRVLSLGYNNLSGEIPSDFSNLTDLTTVYLSNNNFSGNIPSGFFTLPYLTRLSLANNEFSGEIPDIRNADKLNYLNVSNNKLVGRIPRSLSKFPRSAFSNNINLCGVPFDQCNASYPPRASDVEPEDTSSNGRRAIFGIYSGSTMLILILLSSLGKKIYQHVKSPSESSELMERKKLLTLFADDDGFDFDDLLKTTAEVLGEGSTVTVSYKQVLMGKNKTVVVKILRDVVVSEEEFRKTMEVLGKIKNKCVVPLRAFYNYSSDEKMLVYDYMPDGSLSARLHGCSGYVRTQFDWDHRMRVALNVAKGLEYLHMVEEMVHGNIKSSNIFLQQEPNNGVSLSDYGLNTLFRGSSSFKHRVTGYWAPEVLETQEFTFESDVYSFGVLLLELLTRKIPNHVSLDKEGVHFSDWVGSIINKEPKVEVFDEELPRDHNPEKMVQLLRIAKYCILIEPKQRPRVRNVVSMMEAMLSR